MSFHLIREDELRRAHLVCHAPRARTQLRGFLRARGIHPRGIRTRWSRRRKAIVTEEIRLDGSVRRRIQAPRHGGSGFMDIVASRMRTSLCVYRLTGDDWLRIRAVELPATDWPRLWKLIFGYSTLTEALP